MDRKCGFVIFFLGVFILWQGWHLPIGSLRMPGPGFFPAILAAVLIILSLFLIIPRPKRENKGLFSSEASISRVLTVFVAMVAYFLFLEYLGFILVSFLLITFLYLAIGSYRWHRAVLQALISVGIAYVLFGVLLKSQLPKGVLGF